MTPTEVALGYIGSFASGDPAAVAAWVTEDFANNQMGELGSRFTGRALYRERLEGFLGRFQGLRYEVAEAIGQGDRVAVTYRMTAEDGGRPLAIDGVMVITVANGLVSRRDDYWDGLSYCKQMGMTLPLGG